MTAAAERAELEFLVGELTNEQTKLRASLAALKHEEINIQQQLTATLQVKHAQSNEIIAALVDMKTLQSIAHLATDTVDSHPVTGSGPLKTMTELQAFMRASISSQFCETALDAKLQQVNHSITSCQTTAVTINKALQQLVNVLQERQHLHQQITQVNDVMMRLMINKPENENADLLNHPPALTPGMNAHTQGKKPLPDSDNASSTNRKERSLKPGH